CPAEVTTSADESNNIINCVVITAFQKRQAYAEALKSSRQPRLSGRVEQLLETLRRLLHCPIATRQRCAAFPFRKRRLGGVKKRASNIRERGRRLRVQDAFFNWR